MHVNYGSSTIRHVIHMVRKHLNHLTKGKQNEIGTFFIGGKKVN